MIILLHIVSALVSLVLASMVAFRATPRRFVAHYAFVASTVATGTVLLIQSPSHLATSCAAGIAYLVIAGALTVVAYKRQKLSQLPS